MIISELTAISGGTVEAGVPPAALSRGTSAGRRGQLDLKIGGRWEGVVVGPTGGTGGGLMEEGTEEGENGNLVEQEGVDDEKFKKEIRVQLAAFREVHVDQVSKCTRIHKIYSITYISLII